jgi:hypothetical protein
LKTTSDILYWFCNSDDLIASDIDYTESSEIAFIPEVSLFKLKSGNFQVTKMGEFKAILGGSDYILIREDIARFLYGLLPNEIIVRNVIIHRKASGDEWRNYSEIIVEKEITFDKYSEFTVDGIQVYKMLNSLLYVSSEVKDRIIEHFPDLNGMSFKQGFPIMGG